MTKCVTQKEWFSVQQCLDHPENLYVFGDNIMRVGNGGQAVIRGCENSYGIATKRTPSMHESAFFSDTNHEYQCVFSDLLRLEEIYTSGKYEYIIFPSDGLGTGLARMPEKSPILYRRMNEFIQEHFGIVF